MIRIRGPDAAGRIGDCDTRRFAERRFTNWRRAADSKRAVRSSLAPRGRRTKAFRHHHGFVTNELGPVCQHELLKLGRVVQRRPHRVARHDLRMRSKRRIDRLSQKIQRHVVVAAPRGDSGKSQDGSRLCFLIWVTPYCRVNGSQQFAPIDRVIRKHARPKIP